MEIKTRNGIINVSNKDVVLFNGACWQLLTQTYFSDYHYRYYLLNKAKCEKWVKDGVLVLKKASNQMGLWYYRFNV